VLNFIDIDRKDQSIPGVEILEVEHQLHGSVEYIRPDPRVRIFRLERFNFKTEGMIGSPATIESVKEVIGDTVTLGVLVGVDHQLGKLGVGYPALECDIERITMGIRA
jgi:hypothetical protein